MLFVRLISRFLFRLFRLEAKEIDHNSNAFHQRIVLPAKLTS